MISKVTIVQCKLDYLIYSPIALDEKLSSFKRGEWYYCTIAILVETKGNIFKKVHSDYTQSHNVKRITEMYIELLREAYNYFNLQYHYEPSLNIDAMIVKSYSKTPKLR